MAEEEMTFDRFEAVLVADGCEATAAETVRRLIEADCDVIGPVTTARMALALAAQTPIRRAVVAAQLGGVRDGAALAEALATNWGVESLILPAQTVAASDGEAAN